MALIGMSVENVRAREHRAPLPRDVAASGAARRVFERWFGRLLDVCDLDRVKLLTTELVTNAVVHGTGQITVSARLVGSRLRVEVTDEGRGFKAELGRPATDQVGRRGLMIVDAEAARWGIHAGASRVWFELELR